MDQIKIRKSECTKPPLPTTLNPTQIHWSANILAQVQALTDNIIGSKRTENKENCVSTNHKKNTSRISPQQLMCHDRN